MAGIMRINSCSVFLPCLLFSCFFCIGISDEAPDSLGVGDVMKDAHGRSLVSSSGRFRFLFFNPDLSSNRYLGIQDTKSVDVVDVADIEMSIVWVANLHSPLNDTSGVLNLTQDGNLVITNDWGISFTINSAKSSNTSASPTATLLDSGNLVLRDGEMHIIWQSFDYPTDTFLSGMKLGTALDSNTGQLRNRVLTSWLTPQVPADGAFTLGVDPTNTKQLVIWQRGVVYWRSGIWNGYNFSNLSHLDNSLLIDLFNFSYISNDQKENYFNFTTLKPSWIRLNSTTLHTTLSSDDGIGLSSGLITVLCDYGSTEDLIYKGCVTHECGDGHVFVEMQGFYINKWYNLENYNLGISDCKELCMRNCSCNAFASIYSNGTGCKFSPNQKPDGEVLGQSFYVRSNTSNINDQNGHPRKMRLWLIVGAPVVSLTILTIIFLLCCLRWKHCCFGGKNESNQDSISQNTELLMYKSGTSTTAIDELSGIHERELSGKKGHELLLFNFSSIQIATDNFSDANKLGQGGFGPVYKGKLVHGQEIAVKRLSRNSGQGLKEFKNEVELISKLQHRNLVRLLGCCSQGEERILIYEYFPNKSLDSFLFDATKGALLDWKKRACIIEGIAQGLLYLHKYSRLKVIHRDLKTGNILLDDDMNPKISDFGTARIFGENESRANTNTIVGTYGYMSPEYAMDGLFSVKSDVFSFGVMMLEIISGKKNTGFYQPNRHLNLLGLAWDLYKEGRCLELIDPVVDETCSRNEVMRYVQVGLLCVQESAVDRPTMSDVASMLGNELMTLPAPKQPAFSTIVSVNGANLSENSKPCSLNNVTITEMGAR